MSCCSWQWDSAITSTIYASVAYSKVIKACFVHSRGCISGNSSVKIRGLTTSWYSISRTVWTNAFVDHGGFPFQAVIHWSCSSLRAHAVCYMVCWRPFPSSWIYSHPSSCCFLSLLLPVLWMMFQCAYWVICLLTALAELHWTDWCLRSCCVPMIAVIDVAPTNQLDLDPLSPGWGGCVSMICWCEIGEEDDNEKKWEALRTIYSASCQNRIRSSQHDCYTQDESRWEWLQVAGVSHHPAICNMSVRCCLFVNRDQSRLMTAEITWFSDIDRILFKGKEVCWCLSQIIPGILHETDAENQVMLYG